MTATNARETYKLTRTLERDIAKAVKLAKTFSAKGMATEAAEATALEQSLRAQLARINPLASYWSGSITASVIASRHLARTIA